MVNSGKMISRRWLINFVLILLIIVFTYIGSKYNEQSGYQPDNRITDLKAADINSILIKTADTSINLSKVDGIWHIKTPVLWYADNVTVERIIDIVNAQTDSKLPVSEIDPATIGLQFPKAILRLNDIQLTFGTTNNIGERRYVQIDETVYLLKDRYLPFMTQGVSGLLDRRLLPRVLPLKSLKLPELALEKQQGNVWTADSTGLTDEQATQIIENWQTQQSQRIEHYRADHTPKQKVTAVLETGSEIEFDVLAMAPKLVIARADLGFEYHFKEQKYYGLLAAAQNESGTD